MSFANVIELLGGVAEAEEDEEEEVKESSIIPQNPGSPRPPVSERPLSSSAPKQESRATLSGGRYTSQFKLVVIEPSGFDESPKLVDSLKAKKPVVINLENLETDVARKIFDFLSGATYALNGNVQNFCLKTFDNYTIRGSIYTPSGKGKHPLIICPIGHFNGGRYNKDLQKRYGTLARMGAICVSYDLWGWGESEDEVGSKAHRTSFAHQMQIVNGLKILDWMIQRKDVDRTRVGVNGGSGGGTQTVLLSVLDDRFTASCPVVSMSSWFDGGCPCESGMPIQLSGGGTCNAELAATFAPKPMMIISDGGDWTSTTPTVEFPFVQRVYGFYDAKDNVQNIHLPNEKHDFGPNKRSGVYKFFAETFQLDATKIDEDKVTIEDEATLRFSAKKFAM